MSTAALVGFLVVAVLTVITPGLDSMLVLRHSLVGGRRAGLAVVAGINIGCLAWGTATIVGLTALLTASTVAYTIVRIMGAAYLLWLGASMLWKTLRRKDNLAVEPAVAPGGLAAFRAGLVTNLLNPKVGVFYMSLLPQFLPAGGPAAGWGALLVGIHLAIGLVWLPFLVWTAGMTRRFFQRARVRRWLDRITATVLIGLGVKLAAEAR